jgi:hypothetical protein
VHLTCHSKCNKENIYWMGLDTQRYCCNCSKWFHVTCLEATDNQCKGVAYDIDSHILCKAPADLAAICMMPIERSATCILGLGGLLKKALELLIQRDDDWRSILGERFIQKMLQNQEHTVFECAECNNFI